MVKAPWLADSTNATPGPGDNARQRSDVLFYRMWDVVGALRRHRVRDDRPPLNDGWSLEDIHARYGSRLLTKTQTNPELARRVEFYITWIEEGLEDRRYHRYSRAAFSYLSGYANGAPHTMFDPEAELHDCGHHRRHTPGRACGCRISCHSP